MPRYGLRPCLSNSSNPDRSSSAPRTPPSGGVFFGKTLSPLPGFSSVIRDPKQKGHKAPFALDGGGCSRTSLCFAAPVPPCTMREGLWRTSMYATPSGPASLCSVVQNRSRRFCRTGGSRSLRLTLLAPDIQEAILNSTHPAHLTLADFVDPFPHLWGCNGSSLGSELAQDHSSRYGHITRLCTNRNNLSPGRLDSIKHQGPHSVQEL